MQSTIWKMRTLNIFIVHSGPSCVKPYNAVKTFMKLNLAFLYPYICTDYLEFFAEWKFRKYFVNLEVVAYKFKFGFKKAMDVLQTSCLAVSALTQV